MAPPPGIVEVRCAGCGETLEVEPGLTEFACPDCGTHQALPPELMPRRPRRALPLPGRCAPLSAAPSRVTCGECSAVLSVPHGQGRFACPLCGTELATSPAAAVSVVAPPAAVPITPRRPAQPSVVISVTEQVCPGPSSRLTNAGPVQKAIQSEQTHGQLLRHSFREDPFTSSRAETGTEIPVTGRLENEPANPLSHGEESHIEPLFEIISRPSKKNSRFVALPDSYPARKVHEEHPNQSMYASEAQEMPSFYRDMAEDRSPNDTVTVHSKQKVVNVVAPSILEQEQTKFLNQAVDRQQAGEIPNNMVHADELQVDFSSKAENSKKSVKGSKGRPKRISNILMNSSNELPHLRRSKRLIKGSHDHDLLDIEPIEKIDASPNQNLSEAQETGRTSAGSDPSSPARYQFPHGGSNEWDGVDVTTLPALHHGAQQAEQFPHSQIPETRWTLPVASSNSWHDHEMPQESFGRVGQLDRGYAEVHSNPIEMQNQDMHGQLVQEACSEKVRSGQVDDAPCGDVLSGSISNSSKKRRGRAPEKLIEPREEADRPVLMPSGTDWNVHPPCPKLATTLSLLVKRNYPGIYVSNDTRVNGQSCENVVYHWHQCPPDTRATILHEFLKRYRWSPGHEEECQKIFDRKAVRQLTNLFCYEKQRVRQILAAKKTKKTSLVRSAHGEMGLEEDGGREDSDEQQVDKSVVILEHEDPLRWKPFVPVWMKPKWWEMLCDHWAKDEVMKMSYQQRKNRNSGTPPCNAARLRKITLHEQIVGLDNGGKLAVDINSPTEILREPVGKRVCQTEDTRDQPYNEAQDTQHSVQKQVGSGKRGRYCGGIDVRKKIQHESLSKSPPVCVSKQGQQPMFTKEKVQEMINQALQGLNEAWEKKFLSLEQKMPSMSSSCIIPNGVKESSLAAGRSKRCNLAEQDTLDSMDGGKDPSAGDHPDYQDDEEHSS